MKFNFFDKFFMRRKEEKKKERINLKFSELKDFLDKKENEKKREFYKESKPLTEKIFHCLKEIEKIVKELERKEISEEIPQRARKVIQISKPEFIEGVLSSIKFLKKEGRERDIEKFSKELGESLDKIGKLLISKGRYLPFAFSEEMEKFGKKSKELLNLSDELKKSFFSTKDESTILFLQDYNKIESSLEKFKNFEITKKDLREKLSNLKIKKDELEKKYNELEKSEEFKEFLVDEKRIDALLEEQKKIEFELNNLLLPLKRPLKKFKKFLQKAEREDKRIDLYIQDSLNRFFESNGGEVFEILRELKSSIDSEEIKLKVQEENKVNIVLEEFERIKKLRGEYLKKNNEIEEIKKKVHSSKLIEYRKGITNEISTIDNEIKNSEEELEKIKIREKEMKEKILNLKKEFEEKLSIHEQKEVSISIPDFYA